MSQIKFYIDISHDYVRAYRVQLDGSYRQLNDDFSIISGDFISDDPIAVRSHIPVDGTATINGRTYPLNRTSGTLGESDRLNTQVYVQRDMKPDLPSDDDLKQVVASGDDSRSNVLILNVHGKFELRDSHQIDHRDPTIVFRYESFVAGNGYIGPKPANDENFIHSLYSTAIEEWRGHLESGRVGFYRDYFSRGNIEELKAEIAKIVIP